MVLCKILTNFEVYIKRLQKGFTLIELIIVISITLVLLTLVYPQFNKLQNNIALKQAANQLAADIRYIKQKSISNDGTGLPHITVVPDQEYYNVYINGRLEKRVDLAQIYDRRVEVISCSNVNNKISFNYLGSTSNAGTITLQNLDGKNLFIVVSVVMGRVRIDTQRPTSWE